MAAKTKSKIETVPLPERPVPYEVVLPYDTLQLLGEKVFFSVRTPWILGIRISPTLVERELATRLSSATALLLYPGSTRAIGTWPTPEQPLALEYAVSAKLLGIMGKEIRLVVQEPWVVAATVPPALVRPDLRNLLSKKDRLVLVP